MLNFEKDIPFDPGYAKNLIVFAQVIEEGFGDINRFKNGNQKKMRFMMYLPKFNKALKSTLGFWKGCLIWAVFIKNRFAGRNISGNNFLDIKKEDLEKYFYEHEFAFVEEYIKDYSKNTQACAHKTSCLPVSYLEILNDYREFLKINDNFLNTRTTSDIKLPKKFEKNYTEEELNQMEEKIEKAVMVGDLSIFLE